MCNESIEELMLSKLTSEELQYAKQEIAKLSKGEKEQLSAKIREEQKPEKYENLSMVDSYILHIIFNINFVRDITDASRELRYRFKQQGFEG